MFCILQLEFEFTEFSFGGFLNLVPLIEIMAPAKRRTKSCAMSSFELLLVYMMSVSLNAAIVASQSNLDNLKFVAIVSSSRI